MERRKTQTRRVVKYIPALGDPEDWCCNNIDEEFFIRLAGDYRRYCPYGISGNRLWVRETWAATASNDPCSPSEINTDAGKPVLWYKESVGVEPSCGWRGKWRPSIFMPRWASRITLEVVDVRVERLKDISEKDSRAEGIFETPRDPGFESWSTHGMRDYYATPRRAFKALWDSINVRRGYGWDTNPWVWVVEFRVI